MTLWARSGSPEAANTNQAELRLAGVHLRRLVFLLVIAYRLSNGRLLNVFGYSFSRSSRTGAGRWYALAHMRVEPDVRRKSLRLAGEHLITLAAVSLD